MNIRSLLAVVPKRNAASRFKALLLSHSSLANFKASRNSFPDPLARSRESRTRISSIPKMVRVSFTFFPSSLSRFNPSTNRIKAPPASSLNFFLKSAADIPAVLEKVAKSFPPLNIASCILIMTRLKAVPPASASIPTELRAAAKAIISGSANPICLPAPANLIAIVTISASVVAILLPS